MKRPNTIDGPYPLQEHKALQPGEYAEFDPDELKGRGERCQSIIYTDRLYLDPDHSNRSHSSFFARGMSKTAKAMQADLSRYLDMTGYGWKGTPKGWFELYDRFLFGRVGNYDGRRVVSFWGKGADDDRPSGGPISLIPDCVQALLEKGAIDEDAVIVYGDGRVSTAGVILGGQAPGEGTTDPKARERIELAKRMHLATGSEKKAIMAQLGVGGAGSKRSEWDTALQKLPKDRGGLAPGQNMWRMTSESKQHALERALAGITQW